MTGDRGRGEAWLDLHSSNVRICHWINVIACGYLLLSGVHIFLDFPELYWGHTGYQGHPAVFRLSDWGLSWDEAGRLGNRMWGRNYHVTFAWVFLINGFVYVGWNITRRHFRDRMVPATDDLTAATLRAELSRPGRRGARTQDANRHYGPLQKVSYLVLIFVFTPLMILTGVAQSPGFTAAMPGLLDLFGGRQSARTLHTIGTVLLVLFAVVHVLEVVAAGWRVRLRSMITGRYPLSEEGQ